MTTALIATLRPRTAFATPLAGDTLFGQLCWAIRHGWGEARLLQLLEGYTAGRPFLIVSDAFPAEHLPLPALPPMHWASQQASADERKENKKKIWLPVTAFSAPLANWQDRSEQSPSGFKLDHRPQPRNSLNRLTGTTGEGEGFSPYTVHQFWYRPQTRLDIHLRLDEARQASLSRHELIEALQHIGASGYGKDASAGLGKFELEADALKDAPAPAPDGAPNAWFTLAPCAPQGLAWDSARCFYRPLTRYGRHGDLAARGGKSPFKSPLLLAATGALLAPRQEQDWQRGWVGQGLGGDGTISQNPSATVHQGYAPALPVRLPATVLERSAA